MASSGISLSVIIPAYRAAKWIGESLDSVYRQTYTDYEVIVIDQDRDEAMRKALRPYPVTHLQLRQPNVSAARNLGIRHASGEWIANLDADDIWLPHALETMVRMMRTNHLDAISPNAVLFGDPRWEGKTFQELFPTRGHPISYEDALARRTYIYGGVLYSRRLALRVGLYDESLPFGEDFDLWLRMLRSGGNFDYTEEVLCRYRRHPDAACSTPHLSDVLRIYASRLGAVAREHRLIRQTERSIIANHYMERIKAGVRSVMPNWALSTLRGGALRQ